MLKRAGETQQNICVRAGDLNPDEPFAWGLEFNAPVHGTWNIVHIGMQVPQSHQIYVCADNCMRGVIMTAAEMGALDRISAAVLEESDMVSEDITKVTVDAIEQTIDGLPQTPKAVIVFPVCIHHYLGCDMDFVYSTLEKKYPQISFIRAFMDPIMQKLHTTPEQTLRRAILEPVKELPAKPENINILGLDVRIKDNNDLVILLKKNGFNVRQIRDFKTFEEYKNLGDAALNICPYPTGDLGVKEFSERINRPYLYLPFATDYDEIETLTNKLCETLKISAPDTNANRSETDNRFEQLKAKIGDTKIAIDYTAHPRPLGLAKFLLDRGFNVRRIYLDSISDEEKEAAKQIIQNYPDLLFCATVRPEARRATHDGQDFLCIGQKAAWMAGSEHFVNIVEAGGLWGFSGLRGLADLMEDAFDKSKDTSDIVPRKGLGCVSLI